MSQEQMARRSIKQDPFGMETGKVLAAKKDNLQSLVHVVTEVG